MPSYLMLVAILLVFLASNYKKNVRQNELSIEFLPWRLFAFSEVVPRKKTFVSTIYFHPLSRSQHSFLTSESQRLSIFVFSLVNILFALCLSLNNRA